MQRLDAFAHLLPPQFYQKMLELEPTIPERLPFVNHPLLQDYKEMYRFWDGQTKQIISNVNINPEDYTSPELAYQLCKDGNDELKSIVHGNRDMFYACVAMLPMNNIDGALQILSDQVQVFPEFVGVQLFTRALGKSIADAEFEPIFSFCHQHNIPIWLHPVFDERKPDNNIIFSWEYELIQSMLEIVQSAYFKKYPSLKIIVHHAGAMIPYFAGRINHILPQELADDFKKFYVDTALLGNPKAIELAVDYFGDDHVVFGTDAPLGIAPAGATVEIIKAIDELPISHQGQEAIYHQTILKLIGVER